MCTAGPHAQQQATVTPSSSAEGGTVRNPMENPKLEILNPKAMTLKPETLNPKP